MRTPTWLDQSLYPFQWRTMDLPDGRIHYVDEGQGPAILFVHGTPTWSFLYRKIITELSSDYRCVALDHLGFGLSDKPRDGAYRPEDHARRLGEFIERLELRDITLVVHDFGGPIGLAYAIDRPENVRALVLANTWMWSLRGNPAVERAGRLVGGPFGRFLYTRLNASSRCLLKAAWGDKARLTKAVHAHYTKPFARAAEREAPLALARALLGSSDWYGMLWDRRERLAGKPALLLWGRQDPTFGAADLARWQELFPSARTVRLDRAGHFVPDEAPEIAGVMREFLAQRAPSVAAP